jgi:hypothetical protein
VVDVLTVDDQIILNWQRSLCEGDQEIVKRTGRDEPLWVAIHKCMETMLGISLYSYLYLKLTITLFLSHYLLCFLFYKIREEEGQTGTAWKWWWEWGEVAKTNNVYTCK